MITCPECKKKISENAGVCPNYGDQLTPEKIAESKQRDKQAEMGLFYNFKSSLLAVVFFLFLASISISQEAGNKMYQIILKDGATIETSSYKKKDNIIHYSINGIPGFVSLDIVENIIEKQLKKEIIKSLKMWEPLDVLIRDKSIIITAHAHKITETIYTTMIYTGLFEFVYSMPNGWPDIEKIIILNSSKTQGYVFEGGNNLVNLIEIPTSKPNPFILSNTHTWISDSQKSISLKYISKSFHSAITGEYWYINDSGMALMHLPLIPSDMRGFKEEVIVILDQGTKIEIIKSHKGWKEVFIINEISNKRILRGWLLASSVKCASALVKQ